MIAGTGTVRIRTTKKSVANGTFECHRVVQHDLGVAEALTTEKKGESDPAVIKIAGGRPQFFFWKFVRRSFSASTLNV